MGTRFLPATLTKSDDHARLLVGLPHLVLPSLVRLTCFVPSGLVYHSGRTPTTKYGTSLNPRELQTTVVGVGNGDGWEVGVGQW